MPETSAGASSVGVGLVLQGLKHPVAPPPTKPEGLRWVRRGGCRRERIPKETHQRSLRRISFLIAQWLKITSTYPFSDLQIRARWFSKATI